MEKHSEFTRFSTLLFHLQEGRQTGTQDLVAVITVLHSGQGLTAVTLTKR